MKILLVRLRLIGDVVFTTPSVRAIRRRFPDAHIDYIVEEEAAPVIIGNPHVDDVIVACSPHARGRLRADVALMRRLRRERYDLAIDFHGGPRSSLLTWASGARTRIGYEVLGRSWMYTTRVPRPRALRPRHSVVSQWDVLTPLGIGPPDPEIDTPEMPEDPDAAAAVDHRLEQAGVSPQDSLIVVHVSAGNPFRRWPQASFVDVVCQLVSGHPQRRIILTSGPSDEGAASAVAQEARSRLSPDRRPAVVLCGEFNLAELRSLVGRAALYIGGDSGPLHVAGTTGVPVVGLYGPTLPVRSEPYRGASFRSAAAEVQDLPCRPCDQRRCVPGDFRCLTRISPDRVTELAEQLLNL